ncbi:radical SAM/SPASM domain-containing protein [Chloroflexota bacterium]
MPKETAMVKRLFAYFESISLVKRELIIRVLHYLINFPAISPIYHRVYYAVIRNKASHGLAEMDIEPYNVCNLRCVMCPYPRMTREKIQMSMDLFKKIVDDAARNNIRGICLNNCNAPLLDPLLFERIEYAKDKGLRVGFFSNGSLLTKDKRDVLLNSGLDWINFSIDGATKETYERIRVGASFEKTRDNVIGLIEERNERGLKKPSITVWLVAQRGNYHEIKQFKSFWKGFADNIRIESVDERSTSGLLPEALRSSTKPRRLYPCRLLIQKIVVMSNGKVALCCIDYDGSTVLGDLNKQTINEIWDSDRFKRIRELHLCGRGDGIELCRDTNCRMIYRQGAHSWWRR